MHATPESRPAAGTGAATEALVARIASLRGAGIAPVIVALDGRSGAGKSTLAAAAGASTGAVVIDGDDFYRGGSDAFWQSHDAGQKVELVIDWQRQREVLEGLRRHERVTWLPYDWDADDGRRATRLLAAGPAAVVILDGAYSGRAELADLLTLRVLVEVPRDVRRARLLQREGAHDRADWEARWSAAEDLYFETMMPPDCFDLVLDTS